MTRFYDRYCGKYSIFNRSIEIGNENAHCSSKATIWNSFTSTTMCFKLESSGLLRGTAVANSFECFFEPIRCVPVHIYSCMYIYNFCLQAEFLCKFFCLEEEFNFYVWRKKISSFNLWLWFLTYIFLCVLWNLKP